MIDDPDPEVRHVVAQRIAPEWLLELIADPDASVCLAVAERIAPAQLLPLRSIATCASAMRLREGFRWVRWTPYGGRRPYGARAGRGETHGGQPGLDGDHR